MLASLSLHCGARGNSLQGGVRLLLSGRAIVPLPVAYMERLRRVYGSEVRRRRVTTKAPRLTIYCAYNPKMPLPAPANALLHRLRSGAAERNR